MGDSTRKVNQVKSEKKIVRIEVIRYRIHISKVFLVVIILSFPFWSLGNINIALPNNLNFSFSFTTSAVVYCLIMNETK